MDDIIRIVKSLENSGILIDGVGKTVKNEIKKQEARFFVMLLGTLNFSVLECNLIEKGVMRAWKGVVRAGREYNNKDDTDKNIYFRSIKYINYKPRFNGVFSKEMERLS